MNKTLADLIGELPEVYQSIYNHPELSSDVSRVCDDRLIEITKIYRLLEQDLGRPLKVLDLGCAQGYFSLSLAQLGATVQSVDFLDKNIAVCNALADENKSLLIKFDVGRIENILSVLKEDQYDLVLGLSVFHHLVYEHGLHEIQKMLAELAKKIKIGIFELALSKEPLYWGNAQANPAVELLNGFLFTHEIKKYPTHLSHINRPLVVVSNKYWILNNQIGEFSSCLTDPHGLANGTHQGTRKYYLSNTTMVKLYKFNNKSRFEINAKEYKNEIEVLKRLSQEQIPPKLFSYGENEEEAWVVRENLEGSLLLDKITNKEKYDSNTVIQDILVECVKLEELGLYHSDLRTWNIIIDKKGSAKLIDFGSISTSPNDCRLPDNIFLAFYVLVKEIIENKVVKPGLIRNVDYNFDLLPEPYRSIFIKIFLLENDSLSFKYFLNYMNSPDIKGAVLPKGFKVFQMAIQQTSSLVIDLADNVSQSNIRVSEAEAIANEAEAKANEAEARASEAEARANEVLHHYHCVVNSRSWKITKPLRSLHFMKAMIKKIFKYIDKKISNIVQYLISKKVNTSIDRPIDKQKKILIDCSFIYTSGLNTGIQRVVRNIVSNIGEFTKENDLELVTVALVNGSIIKVDMNQKEKTVFDRKSKVLNFIYKIKQKIQLYVSSYKKVETVYKDDILLMLDSTWHLDIWPSIKYAKKRDVKIIGVTYDLIPILHPQFCDDGLVKQFSDWYDKSLLYFDGYIAISKTVMFDVQKYLQSKNVDINQYSFGYFRLGSDFKELKSAISNVREQLKNLYKNNKSIYLIVSTIEPRKNHRYLFDTFKKLWEEDVDVSLVIVGRVGWKTEKLLEEMKNHPEYGEKLWIFNDLDDNELSYCYKNSKALIFPSFVEGYGLPIIESLQNNLPVLASDTPIHSEVGGDMIDYFDIFNKQALTKKIEKIEKGTEQLKAVNKDNLNILTWEESSKQLLEKCINIKGKYK